MSGWVRVRDAEGAEATVPVAARDAYEGRGFEVVGGPADQPWELEPDVDFGPAASEPPVLGVMTPEDEAKEEALAKLAEMGPPRLGVTDDPAKEEILAELAQQTFAGADVAEVVSGIEEVPAPAEDAAASPEADAVADGSTEE